MTAVDDYVFAAESLMKLFKLFGEISIYENAVRFAAFAAEFPDTEMFSEL